MYNILPSAVCVTEFRSNCETFFPSRSVPGELKDWELCFFGQMGMASVRRRGGSSLHGVLHTVTKKEMDDLDKLEGSYRHVPVDIHLYDGTAHKAIVYEADSSKLPQSFTKEGTPTERYIDIIVRGQREYGVAESWVKQLAATKVQPRKPPSEYKSFGPPPSGKTMTLEELKKYDGTKGDDLLIGINGKVIRYVPPTDPKDMMAKGFLQRFAGKDNTLHFARGLYEPRYAIATTLEAMSDDHKRWVEDNATNFIKNYEVVAALIP